MNNVDGIMVKAARQRRTMTALQQTKLVKIWLNRQELRPLDQEEQQSLDEEAAAIAKMEGQRWKGRYMKGARSSFAWNRN